MGQLAAGVAHDFIYALLVIQGWNHFLTDTDITDTRKKATAAIRQATEQAGDLARQLLTFGRKGSRLPKYLLVDQVLSDTLATLARVIPSNISLEGEIQSGQMVFADPAQLQQLLYNLVLNARDAIPKGGKIQVRVRAQEQGSGTVVVLEVEDNGTGMDETIQTKIFEPFFTTKDVGKGTGLGLSTVFGIVEQSDGTLEVRSEVGRGSTFIVKLPAVEPPERGNVSVQKPPPGQAHGRRILVLEDDPLARDLITYALSRAGYAVTEAVDGEDAIKAIEQSTQPFELMCCDAVFPGASLTAVIEVYKQRSNGRVLICSGYVPEDLHAQGIDPSNYSFLPKPFTGSELSDRVASLL